MSSKRSAAPPVGLILIIILSCFAAIGVLLYLVHLNVSRPTGASPKTPVAWDAGPIVRGDLNLTITSVHRGTVRLRGLGEERESPESLLITFRATNTSQDRFLTWKGLADSAGLLDAPSLTDDKGNDYHSLDSAFVHAQGHAQSSRLRPGETTDDFLAFELPLPTAKELTLTMPALGEHSIKNNPILIRIPVASIAAQNKP